MTRMDYSSAGVDIDAAAKTMEKIRRLARKTFTAGTLGDIGSFGGLFRLDTSNTETRSWLQARTESGRS